MIRIRWGWLQHNIVCITHIFSSDSDWLLQSCENLGCAFIPWNYKKAPKHLQRIRIIFKKNSLFTPCSSKTSSPALWLFLGKLMRQWKGGALGGAENNLQVLKCNYTTTEVQLTMALHQFLCCIAVMTILSWRGEKQSFIFYFSKVEEVFDEVEV